MTTATHIAKKRPALLPFLPERGRISVLELVLLAACVVLVAIPLPRNVQDVMILSFLWAALALAWNIAGGFAGLISFGHAAFFGIGAYTSTILLVKLDIPPWIGIPAGAAVSAACGAILALICARLRGPFFILSTLAAAEVVRIGALNWASLTGGPEGLQISPAAGPANMVYAGKTAYAIMMLVFLVIVYALTKWVEASRYGYQLFAVRDDEDAASAAGINPLGVRTSAMALSAALTGVGGSLFAQYFLYLDPTHVLSPELSFQFALLPALGGLYSVIGPVLGAFAITPLSEFRRSYLWHTAAGLHLVIYGFVLIVVMLYFPAGFAGAIDRLRAPKKRGKAQ